MFVNAYSDKSFTVGDTTYYGSIILTQRNIFLWDVSTFQDLSLDSLTLIEYLNPSPESLIIGTGYKQEFIDQKILDRFHELGIEVTFMNTFSAISTFNIMLQEDRNVVLAAISSEPVDSKSVRVEDLFKKKFERPLK